MTVYAKTAEKTMKIKHLSVTIQNFPFYIFRYMKASFHIKKFTFIRRFRIVTKNKLIFF